MKARVKATGEIVDVYCDFRGMEHDFLDETGKGYMSNDLIIFDNEDYEQGWNDGYYEATSMNHDPDYWTRLEHTYAGMAMQGMMNNSYLAGEFRKDPNNGIEDMSKIITKAAAVYAHALVEKLKEKEERK
jgi:hypothetical protein